MSFVAHLRVHMADPVQRAQATQMISGHLPAGEPTVPTPLPQEIGDLHTFSSLARQTPKNTRDGGALQGHHNSPEQNGHPGEPQPPRTNAPLIGSSSPTPKEHNADDACRGGTSVKAELSE